MSQNDFGLWRAIAIHNTSSVAGAASKYGSEASQVATMVKLARALWFIPIVFITAIVFKNSPGKVKIPYIIRLFILTLVCHSYFSPYLVVPSYLVSIAKAGLFVTLLLIAAGPSSNILKAVGVLPLLQTARL